MAEATMTTVDSILKEIYGPRIENQLQNEVTGLKRIERTSEGVVETVGGKYVDFPIKVSRNTGIGYRSESEQLPAPGKQGYAEVHVPLRYGYGQARVTGQILELAEKNYQAFASAMDEETSGLKDDIAVDSGRVFYGDSSGLLASVTADGANTVTVDTVQYLEIGMLIDIRTRSDGTAVAASRTITAIDETTLVVTYDGADVAAAATEGIYRQGNYASGTKREPSGLGLIVGAPTLALHGVDPATQPKWKPVVKSGAGGVDRALSEGLMIETADSVRKNGGKSTVIFGGLGVRRAYFNLLVQQRRYTDTKEFAGGFKGLAFNYGTEIPMVEDLQAPANKMYFVDERKVKVYRSKEWHFIENDGHVLKWVTDYDAFQLAMRQYWEIGTSQRNAHALLEDIIEG